VIGWTRFANLNREDEQSTSTSRQLDAFLNWNDVDANEFASRTSQASPSNSQPSVSIRSPSVHTLRAADGRPQLTDPFALSPSLDASPVPSRALSEYGASGNSVAGSAAPDPLFSNSSMTSHTALRGDDIDATPTGKWHDARDGSDGNSHESGNYFERAESISGATDISETDSRIASFEVAPRISLNGRSALASDVDDNADAATVITASGLDSQAPRFWDDVSGGITAVPSTSSHDTPVPSSIGIAASVRSDPGPGAPGPVSRSRPQAAPRFWDDVSGVGAATVSVAAARSERGPPSEAGSQRTAVRDRDAEAPRFWDDVSGGVTGPQEGGSCRQS